MDKIGKNIILTGDTRGLGLVTKNLLKLKGFNIIGISRNSNDIKYDLSDTQNIKDLYHERIKPRGPIHGFINCAATAYDDIVTNLNYEKLKAMYNVNVFSPMMLTKYVIRDMILNKIGGSLVHVSSVSTHTGYKGLSMYAATKGSLEAFSKNISREWGREGIRSNIVCPGFISTSMSSKLSKEQKEKIFKRNSLKKEISIEGISNTIIFLLSPESESITGQIINVDNGTI
tara:strand:+ start:916 stop:1605 length:690 start_codon:yes stop_codon:yes gene_type:complete